MGATWVSITPFGRVWDLTPEGIDTSFEASFEDNRAAIVRFVAMAHSRHLRVMLVPHLWVESQEWRALIDPGSAEDWDRWTRAYSRFAMTWAEAAARAHVDMFFRRRRAAQLGHYFARVFDGRPRARGAQGVPRAGDLLRELGRRPEYAALGRSRPRRHQCLLSAHRAEWWPALRCCARGASEWRARWAPSLSR